MRTVVLGDLHISAGPHDRFIAPVEQAFVAMLTELAASREEVALVLNGDFLDFVFAPPLTNSSLSARSPEGLFLSFTEAQSLEKLCAIEASHRAVFHAIKQFLEKAGKSVVVIPGNHDADFFWDAVRSAFAAMVGVDIDEPGACLSFLLGPWYIPPHRTDILIGHGHQFDPANAFNVDGAPVWDSSNPPIRRDTSGVARLLECPGTGLLVRFAIEASANYPFVFLAPRIFLYLRKATRHDPNLFFQLEVWRHAALHYARSLTGVKTFLSLGNTSMPTDSSWREIEATALGLPWARARAANRDVRELVWEEPSWLSGVTMRTDTLALENDEGGTLSLLAGARQGAPTQRDVARKLRSLLGVRTVVMGHTHETIHEEEEAQVLNPGAWVPQLATPLEELLQGDTAVHPQVRYDLKYVDICGRDRPSLVRHAVGEAPW